MKLRAVNYCRVSTEEENQMNALARQQEESLNCIQENDWLLVDSYVDEGKSGTQTKNRLEYNRLVEDMLEDRFDIIVVKSQDRLMRNVKDWYIFVDRLVRCHRRLYFYLERKFYSPEDALLTGIKAILAEEYSRELSKKINNAHRNRQRKGESILITSNTWGYDKVGKEIIINEEEAKIVRLIFELCIGGMGSRLIGKELTRRGITNRQGGCFSDVTIRRIIRNPLFSGTAVMNKRSMDFNTKKVVNNPIGKWMIHEDVVPAIVTKEVWEEANKAMDSRLVRRNSNIEKGVITGKNPGKCLLSGKMYCGECGCVFWRKCRYLNSGKKIVDFICSEYIRRGRKSYNMNGTKINKTTGCDNVHLKETYVNNLLGGLTNEIFQSNEEESIKLTMQCLKDIISIREVEKEERHIQLEKKRIIKQKNTLLDKYLEGLISDEDYKRKNYELEVEYRKITVLETIHANQTNKMEALDKRMEEIYCDLKEVGIKKANLTTLIHHIIKIIIYRTYMEIYLDCSKPITVVFKTKNNSM